MNKDQWVNLITKALLTASTGTLAVTLQKYGISQEQWGALVADGVSIAVGAAATWYSHKYNATPVVAGTNTTGK